jgi:hypothetical protein
MNVRLVAITLISLKCSGAFAAEYFVAPNGKDTNPGSRAKPFGSFSRAQEAVRAERAAHPESGVTVTFEAGTYRLQQPLRFTSADSGASSEQSVRFRARPGASVIISGGRAITGWQPDAQRTGVWRAKAGEPAEASGDAWRFDQLWINGRRAVRARSPNYWAFDVLKGISEEPLGQGGEAKHVFKVDPALLGSLQGLDPAALQEVQIVVLHKWDTTREGLTAASARDGTITAQGMKMQPWNPMDHESFYYLENWQAALDSPGEWFLDHDGWLYYHPLPREDMKRAEVVAPEAPGFLIIQGNADKPEEWVRHVRFEGLKFRYGAFKIPKSGLPPGQAAMNIDATAIQLDAARDIHFQDCAIEHVGTTAFWFRHACRDCSVERTRMFDLGIGGVRIGETSIVPEPVRTGNIRIENCILQSGGRIMPHAVAVWIGQNSDNVIAHCDISDFFYTAVSVGWRWGYDESAAKRNRIEYNHLHHLGYRILSDMGGVYTLGPSEGTVVRNNIIHDVYAARYGGWGLYPDEGSTGILFENNLVHDVKDGCLHQHYGKENIFRNNVLAFSREGQLALTRAEPHLSFTFERNLVYWDNGHLLGYDGWKNGAKVQLRNNVYWRAGGKPFDFDGKSWEEWRAQGRDEGSFIADPLFVNPGRRDFRLRSGSPAEKIGFKAIDFSQCGVQGEAAWKKLAASIKYPEPYTLP